MNIFTGNLISKSFSQGNLGNPILLHVLLLGAFFSNKFANKTWIPWFPPEITVRNMAPARIFSLGTLYPTVFLGDP
jgi:hypothetical protein